MNTNLNQLNFLWKILFFREGYVFCTVYQIERSEMKAQVNDIHVSIFENKNFSFCSDILGLFLIQIFKQYINRTKAKIEYFKWLK